MPDRGERNDIETINAPGRTERVDRAKYEAMWDALLPVLPTEAPGMTVADAKAALLPRLDQSPFPGGDKAGWWLKAVQLDLEAKGMIARGKGSPVWLHRADEDARP